MMRYVEEQIWVQYEYKERYHQRMLRLELDSELFLVTAKFWVGSTARFSLSLLHWQLIISFREVLQRMYKKERQSEVMKLWNRC